MLNVFIVIAISLCSAPLFMFPFLSSQSFIHLWRALYITPPPPTPSLPYTYPPFLFLSLFPLSSLHATLSLLPLLPLLLYHFQLHVLYTVRLSLPVSLNFLQLSLLFVKLHISTRSSRPFLSLPLHIRSTALVLNVYMYL